MFIISAIVEVAMGSFDTIARVVILPKAELKTIILPIDLVIELSLE